MLMHLLLVPLLAIAAADSPIDGQNIQVMRNFHAAAKDKAKAKAKKKARRPIIPEGRPPPYTPHIHTIDIAYTPYTPH